MLFGRVRGTAICTVKYPDLKGMKLLMVQPLDRNLDPVGPMQVAVDVVQAGPGDLCVMVRSREAALALREHKFVPVYHPLSYDPWKSCWNCRYDDQSSPF
jgi:ethanolamine utilization protein EutN